MRQVPRNVLENRAGTAAPHAAAFTKLPSMARCPKGSGRSTACRLQIAELVPKGPIVVLLNDQAPGTRRVPPPPRAASQSRHRRAVPASSAGRCGTRKPRAKLCAKIVLAVLRQSIRTINLTPEIPIPHYNKATRQPRQESRLRKNARPRNIDLRRVPTQLRQGSNPAARVMYTADAPNARNLRVFGRWVE